MGTLSMVAIGSALRADAAWSSRLIALAGKSWSTLSPDMTTHGSPSHRWYGTKPETSTVLPKMEDMAPSLRSTLQETRRCCTALTTDQAAALHSKAWSGENPIPWSALPKNVALPTTGQYLGLTVLATLPFST